MGRITACAAGALLALIVSATPARAQFHIDVDIGLGHRPIPRAVYVGQYDAPVYAVRDWRRSAAGRDAREYDKEIREARREYEKDRREADREYWKDRREAEREYLKDRREAQREYLKDVREAQRDNERDRRNPRRVRW